MLACEPSTIVGVLLGFVLLVMFMYTVGASSK